MEHTEHGFCQDRPYQLANVLNLFLICRTGNLGVRGIPAEVIDSVSAHERFSLIALGRRYLRFGVCIKQTKYRSSSDEL